MDPEDIARLLEGEALVEPEGETLAVIQAAAVDRSSSALLLQVHDLAADQTLGWHVEKGTSLFESTSISEGTSVLGEMYARGEGLRTVGEPRLGDASRRGGDATGSVSPGPGDPDLDL